MVEVSGISPSERLFWSSEFDCIQVDIFFFLSKVDGIIKLFADDDLQFQPFLIPSSSKKCLVTGVILIRTTTGDEAVPTVMSQSRLHHPRPRQLQSSRDPDRDQVVENGWMDISMLETGFSIELKKHSLPVQHLVSSVPLVMRPNLSAEALA